MDLTGANRLQEFIDNFTIYALGYIISASGFSVSGIVYDIDRLALWLKISINSLVGLGIFFLVGSNIGMISLESPINIAVHAVMAIILLTAFCLVYYLLSRREADKINAKLREKDTE